MISMVSTMMIRTASRITMLSGTPFSVVAIKGVGDGLGVGVGVGVGVGEMCIRDRNALS